jgi:hypothetical protein
MKGSLDVHFEAALFVRTGRSFVDGHGNEKKTTQEL